MPAPVIRDDFAGAGGWEVALDRLLPGHRVHGVDTFTAAVATARAAGHHREHTNVVALRSVRRYRAGLRGYVASPPCQPFSPAGNGQARHRLDAFRTAAAKVATGATPEDAIAAAGDDDLDTRAVLSLEPLLVIRDHRPQWVALEQVPTALPVWQAYLEHLEALGYHATAGKVHAEQHGAPQARTRAVLVAHLERPVTLGTPTHSRYHRQTPTRLDPDVLPWVTMTEALGRPPIAAVPGGDPTWPDRRPSTTMVASFRPDIVAAPGYRKAGDTPRQRTPGSVLVTAAEAGVLQTFPADYPWQGTTAEQYRQVGNAIPPVLAEAVLTGLL